MLKTRVASVLTLLVALTLVAPAAAESGDGRIAFVSTYSGDADVLSANVDGTAISQVTETPAWPTPRPRGRPTARGSRS